MIVANINDSYLDCRTRIDVPVYFVSLLTMARLVFQLLAVQLVLLATAFGLFSSSKIQHGSKFKLQQKVLTLGSSYTIKDEKDTPVYKVRSHLIVQADDAD